MTSVGELGSAFFVALLVSALVTPFVLRALRALGSRQTVSEYVPEHAAKQGTPTMGGWIILIGFAAAGAFAGITRPDLWILLASFAAIGFLDDFLVPRLGPGTRGLGWTQKLSLQLIAVSAALLAAGWNFGEALTWAMVIGVVGVSNAYNFSDGLDGLAGGLLALIAAAFLALEWVVAGTGVVGLVAACLVGAVIPFLFVNAPPARVFMGDVGSLPIGAVLGWMCLEVLSHPLARGPGAAWVWGAVGLLGLVLLAELLPVPLQVLSVKIRGKRLFPRTPIHHAFQHAGWPETRVTAAFLLTQVVAGVSAVWMADFAARGAGR
ncbi:MAG: phospho-N-acetylmuramoyl-pentapeptide-transferase [Chthonomonadaceae bacterium]